MPGLYPKKKTYKSRIHAKKLREKSGGVLPKAQKERELGQGVGTRTGTMSREKRDGHLISKKKRKFFKKEIERDASKERGKE